MAKQPLDVFIRECLTDNSREKNCDRFVLCHMVGIGRQEVLTQKIGGSTFDPKTLATTFLGRADAYCQDMRGEQRFVLDAYFGESQPALSQPFRRVPDADDGGHGTEPPTDEGRLMQKMRWENTLLQSVFNRQEQIDRRVDRFMDAQDRERTLSEQHRLNLIGENMTMFERMKELMIGVTLDRHKIDMEKIAAEKSAAMQAKLLEMAPIALNMLTGREVVPQSKVDSIILENLVKKMTPEMLPMLEHMLTQAGLGAEEMGVLMMRFNQIKEKQIEDDKARAGLARYNGSAEDDVTGGTH